MLNGRIPPLLLGLLTSALTAAPPAPVPLWDDQVRVTLPGSVHRRLARLEPLGPVPADQPMESLNLVLKLSPDAQSQLDQLLRDQQDPASPRYHQWLTPDQFGTRFGPSPTQLDAATGWLRAQGFTVQGIARSGLSVSFSGTAAQVGKAFRTAMVRYDLDGVTHNGNATSISIPAGLAGFTSGVASLNDIRPKAYSRRLGPLTRTGGAAPQLLAGDGSNVVGPGDFAKIYGLAPLFAQGITGHGATIAVVAQTDIAAADQQAFVDDFNLDAYSPIGSQTIQVVHNGADPGLEYLGGDEFEADVDTQWSTAAAPGATVVMVVSPSSFTANGVDLSAQYIVDNNLADVVTESYGECEQDMGTAQATFYEQLWEQAAAQGMSVFVAAGDNGPAGCADPNDSSAAGFGKGVSGIASTPFNTAVGGTMFNEGSGTYWLTSVTSDFETTALGYIPEAAWNESGLTADGSGLYAGSGGPSSLYAKPSWQTALNVPADGMRDLPDVSFNAAGIHDPSVAFEEGTAYEVGGTSVSSPCMAGIMALVVQKFGGRQGNPNFTLYNLARAQYGGTGPAVFNDVTVGNTDIPGLAGYAAGTGYDEATGLGSLNAAALVANWVAGSNPITVSLSVPTSATVVSGQPVAFSGSATDPTSGSALTYIWSFGDGATSSGASVSHTYHLLGTTKQTFNAVLTATDGTYTQASSAVAVTVSPAGVSAYITLPVTSTGVLPGTPIAFTGAATTQNAGTISTYSWNFGDNTTATGASVTHAFQENADSGYLVTLTATDSTGATGTASITLFADLNSEMDVNGDGSIDVRDLLALSAAWNPSVQATGTGPGGPGAFFGLDFAADLNGAGRVDDTDVDLWISHFAPQVIQ